MNYQLGDTVTAQCKRRLGKHNGRIVEIDGNEIDIRYITITNGFETVHIDLNDWEVKKA